MTCTIDNHEQHFTSELYETIDLIADGLWDLDLLDDKDAFTRAICRYYPLSEDAGWPQCFIVTKDGKLWGISTECAVCGRYQDFGLAPLLKHAKALFGEG